MGMPSFRKNQFRENLQTDKRMDLQILYHSRQSKNNVQFLTKTLNRLKDKQIDRQADEETDGQADWADLKKTSAFGYP